MPLTTLPEHGSAKAARILAAAGELLLARGSRGVTIADVATRAHIGKGTVYLYWKTKEDLLIGLLARDFLALADEVTAAVTADPELARPSRLCPSMLGRAAEHPFVSALQRGDAHLLGALADDPRSVALLDRLGAHALMHAALPIWRANGLARTDWAVEDQAFALHALVTGFAMVAGRSRPPAAEPARVFAAAITALLGPETATAEQVRATAAGGLRLVEEGRVATLAALVTP